MNMPVQGGYLAREDFFMKSLAQIQYDLKTLRAAVLKGQKALLEQWRPMLESGDFGPDAANLAAYVAFRRQDLRKLQDQLLELGLSSLGRCESHVLPTLEAVGMGLDAIMMGAPPREKQLAKLARESRQGHRRLARHSDGLLGKPPANRGMRIMVTLPSLAAEDKRLVHDLARINCAHDDTDAWRAMIRNVRSAASAAGRWS
jgi:pyruvate kinase